MQPVLPTYSFDAKIGQLLVVAFAIFLAPTRYNFLQQQYTPDFMSPSMLIGMFIIILIVILTLYKGKIPYVPKQLWIPYVVIASLMTVSLSFTPNLDYGLSKVIESAVVTTLACFAPFFLFRVSSDIKCFLYVLVAMAILLVAILLYYHPYSDLLSSTKFNTPLGSNYLLIQHVSGMGGLIVLYYFLAQDEYRKHKIWWYILLAAIISAIMYTGGKGPVLAFFITAIFMSLTSITLTKQLRLKIRNKHVLRFPILVAIMGVLAIGFFMATEGFSAFIQRIVFVLSSGHYSQVERLENAKVALDLFSQNPIFGVGIGGFSVYSFRIEGIESFKYPHNIVLEVLSELGLIGFVFLFLILYFAFKHLMRLQIHYQDSCYPRVFMSLFVFTFLNSLTSQDISNPALFAFTGISYCLKRTLREEAEVYSTYEFS